MKIQFAKLTVLVAAIASLTGSQLLAQLAIKSAGSVQKKGGPMEVTVVFTETVDPATAQDITKYSMGGVTVNKATLMTGLPALNEPGNGDDPPSGRVIDNQCVVLEVSGLGTANTTLTVNGVMNTAKTETLNNASKTFVPSGYSYVEVAQAPYSSPAPGRKAGKVIANSDQGFDIFNNGRTAWGNEDEFTFVYKEVTGDFDLQARVEFADFGSRWSRSGIIVRERLDDGTTPSEGCMSRYVTMHSNPNRSFTSNDAGEVAGTRAANNAFESNFRSTDYKDQSANCGGDGSHTAFGNDTAGSGGGTPGYPNAWVRLKRVGSVVTAYYGEDGINWSAGWERTFEPALLDKLYLGPAYCAEWGNINPLNTGAQSRYYMTQVRFSAVVTPYIKTLTGTPVGFIATIQDAQTKFVKNTLKLWLNDVEVPATSVTGPDANGLSTVVYVAPQVLPNNSNNTVKVQFKDDATPVANTITKVASFTVNYQTLPADYATTQFSGTKGMMTVNVTQLPSGVVRGPGDANTLANAETQLANGFIDPATGLPYDSQVPTDPVQLDIVNFSDSTAGVQIDAGWFNSANTFEYVDAQMPQYAYGDQYAMQFVAFAELKAGAYRMFVNSDDGFSVTAGPNGPDVVGMSLGKFDGGRGATLNGDAPPGGFDFVVAADGVYPFRLAYWEGGGDASVEWYTQDYATGERFLVNAPVAKALKTYPTGRGRAYVARMLPYPGKTGVETKPTITADVVDDLTTVDPSTIKLTLDGKALTDAAVTTSGKTHTIKWTAPTDYPFESVHTAQLVYTEKENSKTRTIDYTFTIKGFFVSDLPANSFWIEIEDFDYDTAADGGVAQSTANTMPYAGAAYQGLTARLNIDYYRTGPGPLNGTALGGYMYRAFGLNDSGWLDEAGTLPSTFVPFYTDTAGIAGQRPGGETVTVNYRTGWSGGGHWYNYTRVLPNGIYAAFLAAGHWNNTDAATAGQIDCSFDQVVSGAGTATQTLKSLGTWYGPGAGLSAADVLTPLKGPDGTLAVFKASGKTTFRLTDRAGDIDWISLSPQTGVPPKITQATPANGSVAPRSAPIKVTIEDFSSAAVLNTVKLILDTQDVTSQANPTKNADLTTMQYTPSPVWAVNSTHTYIVKFSDNSVPPKNYSLTNTFTVSALGAPGQFLIEAEDFNFGGGQTKPEASTMPYTGLAYNNLSAVHDVDYHNDDGTDSDMYRKGETPNVNIDSTGFVDRGTWSITTNYKIGWAGTPDWQNYTRTMPAGTYTAYAALSYGGDTNPHRLTGEMALVTSGAATTTQTLVSLGTFDAPGTGGWGSNALVPMQDPSGALATVNLGGTQTIRFNSGSGDMDYFILVPGATAVGPSIVTPPASQTVAAGATVTNTVVVTGTGPLTYEWRFKGNPLAGETKASLIINNVQAVNAGNYSVKVTGGTGAAVTSPDAILTVGGGETLEFTGAKLNADGTITVTWTGGGTLQVAPAVPAKESDWADVTGATSPYTFTPQAGVKTLFARLKK